MKKIFKYELKKEPGVQEVALHSAGELLHVDDQSGKWQLWAQVSPDSGYPSKRKIGVYGTGDKMDGDKFHKHINTFTKAGEVWHAFEVIG